MLLRGSVAACSTCSTQAAAIACRDRAAGRPHAQEVPCWSCPHLRGSLLDGAVSLVTQVVHLQGPTSVDGSNSTLASG